MYIYIFYSPHYSSRENKRTRNTTKQKNKQYKSTRTDQRLDIMQFIALHNIIFPNKVLLRFSSCSLGNLKLNINWHSRTIFISRVQNNFIKTDWLQSLGYLYRLYLEGKHQDHIITRVYNYFEQVATLRFLRHSVQFCQRFHSLICRRSALHRVYHI